MDCGQKITLGWTPPKGSVKKPFGVKFEVKFSPLNREKGEGVILLAFWVMDYSLWDIRVGSFIRLDILCVK